MHLASINDHINVVNILLDKGANVNETDDQGRTPLWLVSFFGHVDLVTLFLDKGSDPDHRSYTTKAAPIYVAAQENRANVVEILLESKASVDLKTKNGHTALAVASSMGHTDVVETLLDKGHGNSKVSKRFST